MDGSHDETNSKRAGSPLSGSIDGRCSSSVQAAATNSERADGDPMSNKDSDVNDSRSTGRADIPDLRTFR